MADDTIHEWEVCVPADMFLEGEGPHEVWEVSHAIEDAKDAADLAGEFFMQEAKDAGKEVVIVSVQLSDSDIEDAFYLVLYTGDRMTEEDE